MRALYEALLEHLGPRDLVIVECVCGHVEQLTGPLLTAAGVQSYQVILDLQYRLRCRECDTRGKSLISIKWSDQNRK